MWFVILTSEPTPVDAVVVIVMSYYIINVAVNMQLLLIHSDYMEYEVKGSTRIAEEIDESEGKRRMEDVLAVFSAAEKFDENDPSYVAKKASEDIREVANRVKVNKILIYPYAHLASDLASRDESIRILDEIKDRLDCFEVERAPFGWYKTFQIKCKGHPLSELSRSIRPESKAIEADEKVESEWYIMTHTGKISSISDFSPSENLEKFMKYELSGSRTVDETSPHVGLMRRLELADYEQGSDPGHLRYYPKGKLIKSLLENHVSSLMARYGGTEVETPVMYDTSHPALEAYLSKFPARQYVMKSDKTDLFLRFSACFGQFLMCKDSVISHKNLPLKLFEIAKYSFRKEKRGELVGLSRLRAFTMPDMHTLCSNMEDAMEEFERQYKLCIETLRDIGLHPEDYEIAIRFTRDFYESHEDFLEDLVEIAGKPVLVEIWDERYFYFILKFEFNFVDSLGKASALSTVQIDVENAERYGISYIDENGEERNPVILHCSTSGAIERCMYALLEKEYKKTEGLPLLPTWLAPTQLRLIPIADRHMEYVRTIASELRSTRVRVDVDDRNTTLNRKIRDAGREWIPYVGVVGDRELKDEKITVTTRPANKRDVLTAKQLVDKIEEETKGYPFKPLPTPTFLSKRPRFFG